MTREVKPPLKLYVETYEFPLYFVLPEDPALEGNNAITGFEEEDRGIWISEHLSDRLLVNIVKHEIAHAINYVYDVDAILQSSMAAWRKEEKIADTYGRAWSQFWLDNPKFVRWYTHIVNRIRKERKDA